MKKITIILTFFIGLSLLAQGAQVKNENEDKTNAQFSKAVQETEKILDAKIFSLNEQMTRHTVLMKMKTSVLPFRTVLYKGKANGDDCVLTPNQEDPANNCIKIEVFDFVNSEDGKTEYNLGAKNKFLVLFYEGTSSNVEDPRREPPRKLTKIRSRIYLHNFVEADVNISEVVDNAPNSTPAHDDKVTVFYQHDGYPEYNAPEKPAEKGMGKYSMSGVENTKTNPIRNFFKQTYYIKHLDYFDRLLTKIFDYNDRDSNAKYRESNRVLKDSLKY